MSPLQVLGLVLALASALALDVGFLLQQSAAARAPSLSPSHPLASARALLASRRWTAGFGLGLGGWALYFAALALAPLSLVQTVAAAGIGLLVSLVAVLRRSLPARRECVGAVLASTGLMALAASLGRSSVLTSSAPSALGLVVLLMLALAALGIAAAAARQRSAALGGLAAGLFYGVGDVTSKAMLIALPHDVTAAALAAAPLLYATAAAHGLGFVVLQRSFQRGGPIASLGPMTAAMTLVPLAAGVLLLGETLPPGVLAPALRVGAFAAVVTGAWLLAVRGAATHARTADRSSAAPASSAPARAWRRGRLERHESDVRSPVS